MKASRVTSTDAKCGGIGLLMQIRKENKTKDTSSNKNRRNGEKCCAKLCNSIEIIALEITYIFKHLSLGSLWFFLLKEFRGIPWTVLGASWNDNNNTKEYNAIRLNFLNRLLFVSHRCRRSSTMWEIHCVGNPMHEGNTKTINHLHIVSEREVNVKE